MPTTHREGSVVVTDAGGKVTHVESGTAPEPERPEGQPAPDVAPPASEPSTEGQPAPEKTDDEAPVKKGAKRAKTAVAPPAKSKAKAR